MKSTQKGNVICLKTQGKLVTVRNRAQGWMYNWDCMEFRDSIFSSFRNPDGLRT